MKRVASFFRRRPLSFVRPKKCFPDRRAYSRDDIPEYIAEFSRLNQLKPSPFLYRGKVIVA